MPDRTALVEAGRSIMSASRLGSADEPQSPGANFKFAMGDLVIDQSDEELDGLGEEIGFGLKLLQLRSYRDVAKAWPQDRRVDASWTAHRTLAKSADRFELIKPGMTLREAQVALGKTPADTEHPSRWSLDRKVPFLISQLQDEATAKAVREQVEGRGKERRVRSAVRSVEEDRSAEYREAQRQFREARDAKHPERAAYEAIFKLRDYREYVRALGKATTEENSFLPSQKRPDLIAAVRDLAEMSIEVVAALASTEVSAVEAITHLTKRLGELQPDALGTGYTGRIIQGDPVTIFDDPSDGSYDVIDGDLDER